MRTGTFIQNNLKLPKEKTRNGSISSRVSVGTYKIVMAKGKETSEHVIELVDHTNAGLSETLSHDTRISLSRL